MDKNDSSKKLDLFENKTKSDEKNMNNKVNLLDLAAGDSVESLFEVVRIGSDEIAIIAFTTDGEMVDIHYCSEIEINSYIICNGPDCVLCRIGRKRDQRLLLPVYLPAAGCVGILPVSKSLRPRALLPQISNVLKAERPMVAFVTRNGAIYTLSTAELRKDVDAGEAVIRRFLDDYQAGFHDFSTVYPRIDNEQLSNVEEIGRMMALKGIRLDASDKRA